MSKKPITLDSLPTLRNGRAKILLKYIRQENGFILSDQVRYKFKNRWSFDKKDVDNAINDLCAAGLCAANPTDSGISVDLIKKDEPEKEEK